MQIQFFKNENLFGQVILDEDLARKYSDSFGLVKIDVAHFVPGCVGNEVKLKSEAVFSELSGFELYSLNYNLD